jgi:cysteinyl-tRNA synthetase
MDKLSGLTVSSQSSVDIPALVNSFYKAMNDDFNAPMLIAQLFEAAKTIHAIAENKATITALDLTLLTQEMASFFQDVLGITLEAGDNSEALNAAMELVLEMRKSARENKDWATSDLIRDRLAAAGITIKDAKEGTTWSAK